MTDHTGTARAASSHAPDAPRRPRYDAPLHGYERLEERTRELGAMGFDGAFTLEGNRDVFFPLVLAARSGAGLDLYPNVAVALPRSPMHLAYQAWDLQHLSGGRFALGLGSQIRPHIERRYSARWHRPVRQMTELIAATRAIFETFQHGAPLDFRGDYYTFTLMTPAFVPSPLEAGPPPIWLAALGPRMTAAAGEVADGVLVHPFNSERYLREHTLEHLNRGLVASGRRREDLTVAVTAMVCVYEHERERQAAESACRANLAFYASTPAYRVTLELHGWGDVQPELNRLSKAGRWAEMGSLIDDDMLDTLSVRGTPEQAAGTLAARYAGIADRVALSVPYGVRAELLAETLARVRDPGQTA